ncbi:MAG: phosphohydrolase [bacterium]
MPPRHTLGLSLFSEAEQAERATHEDFTLRFLLDSDLRRVLDAEFGDGVTPEAIAHLVSGRVPAVAETSSMGASTGSALLTQMVSGELDADRMDYLQRDAFFAGVTYGRFDLNWILENLTTHVVDDRAALALGHRAVFAFEDFLLGRYHMFVSVYYHHVPVGFETMLLRFFAEEPEAFTLPADPEAYQQVDDVTLWTALRASRSPWARRITTRSSFRRIFELNAEPTHPILPPLLAGLEAAGVRAFLSEDEGVLSKYYRAPGEARPSLYVVHDAIGQAVPIQRYARVYERYAQPTRLMRVYVDPDQADLARAIVGSVVGEISLAGAVFG